MMMKKMHSIIRPILFFSFIRRWFLLIYIVLFLGSTIQCRRQSKFNKNGDSFAINAVNNGDEIEEFDDFNCPEKFGYFADSQNCSRYHICDHGKSKLKSCDDGLVFSTILKTCDWPYNVHCNLANGDRGDFIGRHLRLRANNVDHPNEETNDENNIDLSISNRRQPVLTNEADDSYWLGRPDTDLLAYLNDEDYNNDHYDHEGRELDIPRRKINHQQQQQSSRHRHHPHTEVEEPESHDNNNNKEKDTRNQPWFQNVDFDQIHRRNNNKQFEKSLTSTTTTTTTTTTPVSTLLLSTNQRGNNGWRNRNRPIKNFQTITTTFRPTATLSSMLPRRALRIGANIDDNEEEDYLLTDGFGHDLHNYRRQNIPNLKDDRESYRIVSHNKPTTTTTMTTNITTVPLLQWVHTTTPPPSLSLSSGPAIIESRPRHLGTSVRRKVVRKKIIQPTLKTSTLLTTTTSTTTQAPVSFRNQHFWNNNNNNDNSEWKSIRYESVTKNNNPPLQQQVNSVRRTIPKVEHRQRFERKPVLRDPDESEEQTEPRGHDENENNYFYNAPEIVRNTPPNVTINENDLLSKNIIKEVSNNIGGIRVQPLNHQRQSPSLPATITTSNRGNNQHLNKAFDIGFHHAINPNAHHISPFVPNVAADIEYEDVENEDEDESVDDMDSDEENNSSNNESDDDGNYKNNRNIHNHNDDDNNNGHNNRVVNKEIIVRYDDEADDGASAGADHPHHLIHQIEPRRVSPTHHHLNTTSPFVTNMPRMIANNRISLPTQPTTSRHMDVTPTPPRLTRFLGLPLETNNNNINNNNNFNQIQQQQNHRHNSTTTIIPHKINPAIRILDLIPNQPLHPPQQQHYSIQGQHPNPVPFVNIIGPLQSNNKTSPFLSSPIIPRSLSSQYKPTHFGTWNSLLPTNKLTNKKNAKTIKKQQQNKILKDVTKFKKPISYYSKAKRCVPEKCHPPNCRCGGIDIPGGFQPREIPQIVLLTFDDSVNDLNLQIYRRLFEQSRTNPNGCPILATFYVSHEWTDYSQVQNLYSKGHEIASHSISHSFGEKFSKERWLDEILGQKEILHLYGGVDAHEIRGMRAPFLQTGGDTMFEMLHQANFSYDSSLPVYDIDPPYWPYTLDYAITHDCMIEPCPSNSYPGFWEVGMVMWEDLRGGRCSMADGCFNPSDEQGVYEMVKANFLRHYTSNRAPFGMFFHSRWFLTEHNMKGFIRFLDEMLQLDDIYLITNWQMIQWMKNPTPLSHIKKFGPFGCDYIRKRPPLCKQPHVCKVRFRGEIRTLKTCQQCPQSYPWTGNNGNNESVWI